MINRCSACGADLEWVPFDEATGFGGHWRGHGDSEEEGHEGGGPDEDPWCIREDEGPDVFEPDVVEQHPLNIAIGREAA